MLDSRAPDSRDEVRTGDRFAFGSNWLSFLATVDEERIAAAVGSLTAALRRSDLAGCDFLDVGCGSGLFSLAAQRLGANVHSFDFDPESVAATGELRQRFGSGAPWTVNSGSVLDEQFTGGLGQFDVVYSWGVLHHTGDLWRALENTARLVRPGGVLFVSVYNDQGLESRIWRWVKQRYNRSGAVGRQALVVLSRAYLDRHRPVHALVRLVRGRPATQAPVRERGMSRRHDLVDWVGGYPFEVARPEAVFSFLRARGFELRHLKTCAGGIGCNEFVFELPGEAS